jgi:hypothetical protein
MSNVRMNSSAFVHPGVGPCYVATQFGVFVFTSLRTSRCVSVLMQAYISIEIWLLANESMLQIYLDLASTHSSIMECRDIRDSCYQ